MAQIATALTHLHNNSTYHLDIKAPNVVVKGVTGGMLKPVDCTGSAVVEVGIQPSGTESDACSLTAASHCHKGCNDADNTWALGYD